MSVGEMAMSVLTLGGHGQLQAAQTTYNTEYKAYSTDRQQLEALNNNLSNELQHLGEVTMTSFKTAKKARKMLDKSIFAPTAFEPKRANIGAHSQSISELNHLDHVLANFSAAQTAIKGAGAGAAVATGSWSLVALVGTASTGTAISGLSGVAATNATLAWFGGGALAAGGAGMAGGTLVLGGIALAPVVAFAAWKSRSKTKEVLAETQKVRHAHQEVLGAVARCETAVTEVRHSVTLIAPKADALQAEYETARAQLYPVRGWSLIKRWLRYLLGYPFYQFNELTALSRLEQSLASFGSCFSDRTA